MLLSATAHAFLLVVTRMPSPQCSFAGESGIAVFWQTSSGTAGGNGNSGSATGGGTGGVGFVAVVGLEHARQTENASGQRMVGV
jgi:hypothetical protein